MPTSEEQLRSALDAGSLRETAALDFKQALPQPGRNKDLAKDICAMTVDGGVLIYGAGGSDPTRPTELFPFELAGAAERIDQVAQTGITEPPRIEIHDIASSDDAALGYLVVEVPPSPLAPHMLVIDGDNRYWGRGATGNRVLTEQEVARLYERRTRWAIDRGSLLSAAVDRCPLPALGDPEIATLTVFTHPVAGSEDLVRSHAQTANEQDALLETLRRQAAQVDLFRGQGDITLGSAHRRGRSGADVRTLSAERQPDSAYQALLHLRLDGDLTYWQRPLLRETQSGGVAILERSVARGLHIVLAVAAELYRRVNYRGPVDVGVALADIATAIGASTVNRIFVEERTPYGEREYKRDARVPGSELLADPPSVARRLLEPLFDAVSLPGYNPFDDTDT